jgi:hypothetical protein
MVENHTTKANMLTDYKRATLEAEKVYRDSEVYYLQKWEKVSNAYIDALEKEVKRLTKPEKINGIDIIR